MLALKLPALIITPLDSALRAAMPPWAILIVWGALAALASVSIYHVLAPHQRLAEAKSAALEARRAMTAYDGEFAGALELARASLWHSLRHLVLTIGPALAAAIPVLILLEGLEPSYLTFTLGMGPRWAHGWEPLFLASLTVCSLALTFARRAR